jgi:hypothetical protein
MCGKATADAEGNVCALDITRPSSAATLNAFLASAADRAIAFFVTWLL